MKHCRRQHERGFAMLFVFAMAAAFAILLYMELPRLALEMQRNKEEMLIERGEQYARAIQVYVRKNKNYPQSIDDLEGTNGVRFLRRRYVDPMTGKDDWRLIHSNGGQLTDSLVQKPGQGTIPGLNDPNAQPGQQQQTGATAPTGYTVGMQVDPGTQRMTPGQIRRASEMAGAPGAMPPPGGGDGQQLQTNPDGYVGPWPPPDPNSGQPLPFIPYPGMPQQPGQQPNQQPYPQPGQQTGFAPGQPQQIPLGPNGQPVVPVPIPGLPGALGGYPNQSASSQTGGAVPTPGGGYSIGSGYTIGSAATPQPRNNPAQQQGQAGARPNFPQGFAGAIPGQAQGFGPGGGSASFGGLPQGQGAQPGIAVNPATQLIQQLLTTPNPRGLQSALGQGLQPLSGGIAGVASKHDAEGVKVYKDRTNYKEWEFIYDPSKEQRAAQAAQQANQQNQQGIPGAPGLSNPSQQPGTGFGFPGAAPGMSQPPGQGIFGPPKQ
jgi:hypothetical protein